MSTHVDLSSTCVAYMISVRSSKDYAQDIAISVLLHTSPTAEDRDLPWRLVGDFSRGMLYSLELFATKEALPYL